MTWTDHSNNECINESTHRLQACVVAIAHTHTHTCPMHQRTSYLPTEFSKSSCPTAVMHLLDADHGIHSLYRRDFDPLSLSPFNVQWYEMLRARCDHHQSNCAIFDLRLQCVLQLPTIENIGIALEIHANKPNTRKPVSFLSCFFVCKQCVRNAVMPDDN